MAAAASRDGGRTPGSPWTSTMKRMVVSSRSPCTLPGQLLLAEQLADLHVGDAGDLCETGDPVDRLVLRRDLEDREAGHQLLGLGVRAVCDGRLAAVEGDPGGGLTGPDAPGQEDVARLGGFDHERAD